MLVSLYLVLKSCLVLIMTFSTHHQLVKSNDRKIFWNSFDHVLVCPKVLSSFVNSLYRPWKATDRHTGCTLSDASTIMTSLQNRFILWAVRISSFRLHTILMNKSTYLWTLFTQKLHIQFKGTEKKYLLESHPLTIMALHYWISNVSPLAPYAIISAMQ